MRLITELAGRYHLQELIAVGGMGEVWRAVDQVLARPVAVKMLRPEYTRDAVTLARFRAEAQHAGPLNRPGIAQVYDYCDASPDGQAAPGTVLRLYPTGQVRAGSVILLTAAAPPPSAGRAFPAPAPGGATAGGHVPPGHAKHDKGPPPGHG